jgi:hypothetical protein
MPTNAPAAINIPTPDEAPAVIIGKLLDVLSTGRAIEALAAQVRLELELDDSVTVERFDDLAAQLDRQADHGVKLARQ